MSEKTILLIEKMDGIPCPNKTCNGKLRYIAYTAFNCHTCHTGYQISPIILHKKGKLISPSVPKLLSKDDWI